MRKYTKIRSLAKKQRFLCDFLCPPSCSLKESSCFRPSKRSVNPWHRRENILLHIAIFPFVRLYILRLALEYLFAERLAVETRIVKVYPSVIENVKTIAPRLFPRKAHV